ncbi:MAG: sulfur carrier protein ThiS [Victivallaceae bacterium]
MATPDGCPKDNDEKIQVTEMKITVNGKTAEINAGETLAGLIAGKKLDVAKTLASVNKTIIQAGTFAEIILNEGDEIELFCFVSGG